MTFAVAALLAFLLTYVLSTRLGLPSWAPPLLASVQGAFFYTAQLPFARWQFAATWMVGIAAGVAGFVLSEVVSMLQAATDVLRVQVISRATRRTRVPPL